MAKKRGFRFRGAAAVLTVVLAASPAGSLEAFGEPETDSSEIARVWDFKEGAQGWTYDDSWSGDSYLGEGGCEYDPDKGMLKLELDYSLNTDNSCSQTGICLEEREGIDYSPYKVLNFDLYYDPSAFTAGKLWVKAFSDNIFGDQSVSVDEMPGEERDGLRLVNLTLTCDEKYTRREKPGKLLILLVGEYTDYKGTVWIDNITLSNVKREKFLVESTVPARTETALSSGEGALTVNGESFAYAGEIKLADPGADSRTAALYQYLKAVGESDAVLYGHMEDTVLKAGAEDLTDSDTEDMTGSLAAVIGMDCGGMFAGFAEKYNQRHPGAQLPDTNEGNIRAAALFSNEAISRGGVITLSSHMPNFSGAVRLEGEFKNSYDGFDFTPADSYVLTGDCMNQILPGGAFHEAFTAHLDLIADYVSQVDGPVLFRPFHENTGSWFWWGKAFCDPETYKSMYKYTVEYLRDERDIHNLLYLYGPGSEAASLEEYEERYPGDEYVDLVGFDTYDNNPVPDEEGYTFLQSFENTLKLTDTFAKEHGKLMAVTETGMSPMKNGGIPETGNRRPEWYTELLDIMIKPEYDCCYFMLWSNYARSGGYYTPFVTERREGGKVFGHELLDSFISMYNHRGSIFAGDQAEVLKSILSGNPADTVVVPPEQVSGYVTEPVAGQRILGETKLAARLNREASSAEFRLTGGGKEAVIPALTDGRHAEAVLDEAVLEEMGPEADGRISLWADGEKLQEIRVIYNIEPMSADPLVIDTFDSYGGLANLLLDSWSTNKDSGCEMSISLADDMGNGGEYALKFEYKETRSGWAGCELLKEADWSGCDALQFWVKPDGNNQKTVVQINTAGGGSYEAYLQEYPEYAGAVGPVLVTLPFDQFQDKNGRGALSREAAAGVSGFGLWVNAIGDSPAIDSDGLVQGALYYDDIRAVASGKTEPEFLVKEDGASSGNMAEGSGAMASENAGTEKEESEKTEETEAAAVGAANKVPFTAWLLPVFSGLVALAAAGCLAALILEGKKRL